MHFPKESCSYSHKPHAERGPIAVVLERPSTGSRLCLVASSSTDEILRAYPGWVIVECHR